MSRKRPSERSRSKSTRELDISKRADGVTPERYIVRKINRIITDLNVSQTVRRIELVGNLYPKYIRFIKKKYGIIPHTCLPVSHDRYRCFFWIKKDTPIANIDEET